mmetsp:Transcript_14667/g.34828  ORF Transcript_14667/g.34828 Transcript_14667/m.34828 type:complete len:244 (-) Transcript_14667:330-1061(-)
MFVAQPQAWVDLHQRVCKVPGRRHLAGLDVAGPLERLSLQHVAGRHVDLEDPGAPGAEGPGARTVGPQIGLGLGDRLYCPLGHDSYARVLWSACPPPGLSVAGPCLCRPVEEGPHSHGDDHHHVCRSLGHLCPRDTLAGHRRGPFHHLCPGHSSHNLLDGLGHGRRIGRGRPGPGLRGGRHHGGRCLEIPGGVLLLCPCPCLLSDRRQVGGGHRHAGPDPTCLKTALPSRPCPRRSGAWPGRP